MNQAKRQSGEHGGGEQNAIALLTQDHNKVKKLFEEFEMLKESEEAEDEKLEIVQEICLELSIHAQIEEEIFYPAAIDSIGQLDIMDEAIVEHAAAKDLIDQLITMAPEDEHFDAKVTVLREMVEHHIKEEEGKMFPRVRKANMDLAALGGEITQFKQNLQIDMGLLSSVSMSKDKPASEQMQRGQTR
jgi:hypothetical protein